MSVVPPNRVFYRLDCSDRCAASTVGSASCVVNGDNRRPAHWMTARRRDAARSLTDEVIPIA
jgi:hypothetical protein